MAALRTFLDLSTGHLALATRDALSAGSHRLPLWPTEQGWFAYAPEDCAEDTPSDLIACFNRAREVGADYVLFDADAPPDPNLPFYGDSDIPNAEERPGPPAPSGSRSDPFFASPPMLIGKHEWRVLVIRSLPGREERATMYQWRRVGSCDWSDHREWPSYDSDNGTTAGLPRRLTALWDANRVAVKAALEARPVPADPQADLFTAA